MKTFKAYETAALRTKNPDSTDEDCILNAALGLAGEVGEIVEHIKKYKFHDQPLETADVLSEIGDVDVVPEPPCDDVAILTRGVRRTE